MLDFLLLFKEITDFEGEDKSLNWVEEEEGSLV